MEQYFEFSKLGTNWRTEILAGATTFATMAYIIVVNPAILSEAGVPRAGAAAATCISAAFGSILMGALARYPIALAPGMGLNAYFAYVVVQGMGVSWQAALGAVFLSGVIFLLLTAAGIRQLIVRSIPHELYAAVAVGIGLFIALIGFRGAGVIVASPSTLVTLGNLREPSTLLSLAGLLLMSVLLARGVRVAVLAAIVATAVAAWAFNLVDWRPPDAAEGGLTATVLALDLGAALNLGFVEIVFVFLFVDMFDNIGTLVAVGKKAGLFDEAHRIPRIGRILVADAAATIAGSLAGTSTVVSYIESAAGVVAGGRTGVTAIVTGLLFLGALVAVPLAGLIPPAATAPALIIVGALMLGHAAEIAWSDPVVAIPAFLTITAIPLTFSIANGLAFGFISYVLLKALTGGIRTVNWLVYVLAALFVARFAWLSGG